MANPNSQPTATDDPFDTLLTLEDTLYTTAYTLGTNAGSLAGRVEGRIFGLENGFEKFASLGALHGRGVVWAARLPSLTSTPAPQETGVSKENTTKEHEVEKKLPMLPDNTRLVSNTTLLHSLTDPLTFSTENTEEAVADFDDRLKRASAKAKVVERIIGETSSSADEEASPARGGKKERSVKVAGKGKKGDDSMEDFVGSRFLS